METKQEYFWYKKFSALIICDRVSCIYNKCYVNGMSYCSKSNIGMNDEGCKSYKMKRIKTKVRCPFCRSRNINYLCEPLQQKINMECKDCKLKIVNSKIFRYPKTQ